MDFLSHTSLLILPALSRGTLQSSCGAYFFSVACASSADFFAAFLCAAFLRRAFLRCRLRRGSFRLAPLSTSRRYRCSLRFFASDDLDVRDAALVADTRVPSAPDGCASCADPRWRSPASRTAGRHRRPGPSRRSDSWRSPPPSAAACGSSGAMPFLVNASVSSASSTRRPLIRSSTSRAFCGETRT